MDIVCLPSHLLEQTPFQKVWFEKGKQEVTKVSPFSTRNLPNVYVVTAGGVQETELNAQTKHCSAQL